MTSDIASEMIYDMRLKKVPDEENIQDKVMGELRKKFKPELLNRVDDIIIFNPLTQEMIAYIVDIQLSHVINRLKDEKIVLAITDEVKKFITKRGFDSLYGARPLKRVVQKELLDPLAMKIVEGTVNAGDTVHVDMKKDKIDIKIIIMIAHLRSLFFTLIFFGVIESIIFFGLLGEQKGLFLAIFLVIFAVFAGWNVGKNILYSFLSLSLTISSLGLLYFIDNIREQQIFGILVSMLFYMALLGIKRIAQNAFDMTARSLFSASLIAIIFLFYAVVYGVYINFNIPLGLFIGIHFIFVMTVTFVSLRAYSSDYRRIFLYSTVIAFAMIQLVWLANFWPFGYLTMAAISLMFYYVLWDLVQMVFLEVLSKKRIIITIVYCVVLTLTVLLTTQWLLVG